MLCSSEHRIRKGPLRGYGGVPHDPLGHFLEGDTSVLERSRSSSVASERHGLSFTVNQEEQTNSGRESLSSVTRAAARSRAIQKKREEIEEVYRQDCDTFGVVVKMLVAKDPSLERSIQSSLRENLREIGLRCVDAMERFINEYDSKELTIPSQSQHH
ncbi:hypothetical protein C0J50_18301 [Silurus asotus]|uniref:Periphilin-1 C-terminal domain-containing protein n=1 Tax=Silurus asotus TaxID=30991 RepID=A0AAD5AT66_SILAS|nr:hypothetical protein C0J50_18301 [Silurus asotus]